MHWHGKLLNCKRPMKDVKTIIVYNNWYYNKFWYNLNVEMGSNGGYDQKSHVLLRLYEDIFCNNISYLLCSRHTINLYHSLTHTTIIEAFTRQHDACILTSLAATTLSLSLKKKKEM